MTTEQIELWRELDFDKPPQPSGDQLPEHAVNLKIHSFRHTCQFEGLPVPSEDEALQQGGAMKKSIVLIAAIVAVVGFGAVAAVAKEQTEVKTSVTLRIHTDLSGPKPDFFFGEVAARKKGCEKGRKVVLYFPKPRDPDERLGSDRTNNRGKYRIPLVARRAFVEAKEKKITKNDGDKVVCKAGRSLTFHAPGPRDR